MEQPLTPRAELLRMIRIYEEREAEESSKLREETSNGKDIHANR
jgi:hypothetical protein